jgi:hypothetical protein
MEKNVGTLRRVSGHTYDTLYDLFFTTERVIALIIRHPLDIPNDFGVTNLFFGGRLFRRHEIPDRIKIAEDRRAQYKEEPIDKLVSQHRFNFEIPYNKVRSVAVTQGLLRSKLMFRISGPSNAVYNIKFTLSRKQHREAQGLLKQVLFSKMEGS